ncbi:MAG TPA: hypothetical protein VMW47_02620 [Verrucomicrobiae bacterium]|nr:hypothetical protein [Verrucomicrobiae bacterium]
MPSHARTADSGTDTRDPGDRRWRLRRRLLGPALAAGAMAALLGAGSAPAAAAPGGPSRVTAGRAASLAPLVVGTAMESVRGHRELVLTNSTGRTLYYFTADTATHPACTGKCASFWPPVRSAATSVRHPAGVRGRFIFHSGPNGRQLEYNGHPLYTYSGDKGPHQDRGEGLLGKWFVATPSLRPAATKPKPGGGMYGY